MPIKRVLPKILCNAGAALTLLAAMNLTVGVPMASEAPAPATDFSFRSRTPIKHLIVIIGENRTFDHIFATYQPKHGQTVNNLLSEGIINDDGTPGPNFAKAHQNSACDLGKGGVCPNTGEASAVDQPYMLSPGDKALYGVLPEPLAGGPTNVCSDNSNCVNPKSCLCFLTDAKSSENGLAPEYYRYLLTGGTNPPRPPTLRSRM